MYVFAMKKSSCLETDSNKSKFLFILGSHKFSNFKTPPLFNLNVSTRSDALKKRCTSLAKGSRTLWKQQLIAGPLWAPKA